MSASVPSTTLSTIDYPQASRADYRLLGLLGQGQFAQVYCAVYRRTGRLVAIKETRHAHQQASQESVILPSLNHPNIVGCQAISKTERGHRFVLDYCEAGTLRSHLKGRQNTSSKLSLPETQSLIGDLLRGLGYLHQRSIAHGDIKPENLFLTWQKEQSSYKLEDRKKHDRNNDLTLKIGDFGNARSLRSEKSNERSSGKSSNNNASINSPNEPSSQDTSRSLTTKNSSSIVLREIGSPTYAAPERFEQPASTAADLYAVGVIAYELLLGERPFSGSPESLQEAHNTKAPSFPNNVTIPVKQFLTKALHKQPEKRFLSAEEMLTALLSLSTVTAEVATQPDNESAILTSISETSLSQVATAIPSNGITAPIESLLQIPQGCCIVTARSLHLLTPKRKLLSIARFKQPHWIAVAPNGKWFAAVSQKNNTNYKQKGRYRFSQGMMGHLSYHSGHQWRRSISLKGKLLTELNANVLKVIALGNRYLLRVSTTQSKTFFECFTRRGQFIGELSVNFRLTQVTPTAVPYQLAAIKASKTKTIGKHNTNVHYSDNVVLISLKPFQVRTITLPVGAEQISALPWGYLVSYQRRALLLDRSMQITSLLTGLPTASRTAILSKRTLLLTNSTLSSTVSTATESSPIAYKSSEPLSLLVAETSALDLGLIF